MVGKNKRKRKYNYETTKSEENPEVDLSLLRKPIGLSGAGVLQITNCLASGTEELCNLMLHECDVIYECKVCRSLFRSLANFIAHKRVYCKELFQDTKVVFVQQPARTENVIIIHPESPPPTEHDDSEMTENVDGKCENEEEEEAEAEKDEDASSERVAECKADRQTGAAVNPSHSNTGQHADKNYTNDARSHDMCQNNARMILENDHVQGVSDDEVDDSSNCSTATNSKSRTHSPTMSDTEVTQKTAADRESPVTKAQQAPSFVLLRPMQPTIITSALKQKLGDGDSSAPISLTLKPIKTNPHAVYQKVRSTSESKKDEDDGDSEESDNSDESDHEEETAAKRVRVTRSLSHDSRDLSPGGSSHVELVEPEEATGPVHMSLRNRSAGSVNTPIAERLIERGDCDVKSRKCLKCDTQYASLKTLQFHMISLHSEKRRYFPCIYCDEKFSTLWGVSRHIVRSHRKTKEQAEKLRETLKRRSFMQPVDEGEAKILIDQTDGKASESRTEPKAQKSSENRTVKRPAPDDSTHNSPKAKAIKPKSSSRRTSTLNCPNCLKTFYSAESLERHLTFCFASNHVAHGQRSQKPKQSRSRANSENSPKESRSPASTNKKGSESKLKAHIDPARVEDVKKVLEVERKSPVESVVAMNVESAGDPQFEEVIKVTPTEEEVAEDNRTNTGLSDLKVESLSNRYLDTSMEDQQKLAKIIDSEKMVCLKCHQSYSNISNLHRHGIRHLGWKRFKCRLCKYTSYNRSECKIHLRRVHLFQVQRNHLNAYVLDLDQEQDMQQQQQQQQSSVEPEKNQVVPTLVLSRVLPVVSLKKLPRSMSVPGSMTYSTGSESQPESPHSNLSTPTSEHSTKSDTSSDRRKPSVAPTSIYRIVNKSEAKFNISTRKTPREFDMSPYQRVDVPEARFQLGADDEGSEDGDDEEEDPIGVATAAATVVPRPAITSVIKASGEQVVVDSNDMPHLTLCTAEDYGALHELQPSPPPLEPECMDFSEDEAFVAVASTSGSELLNTSAENVEAATSDLIKAIPCVEGEQVAGVVPAVADKRVEESSSTSQQEMILVLVNDDSNEVSTKEMYSMHVNADCQQSEPQAKTHSTHVTTTLIDTLPVTTSSSLSSDIPIPTSLDVSVSQAVPPRDAPVNQNVSVRNNQAGSVDSVDRTSSTAAMDSGEPILPVDVSPSSMVSTTPLATCVALTTGSAVAAISPSEASSVTGQTLSHSDTSTVLRPSVPSDSDKSTFKDSEVSFTKPVVDPNTKITDDVKPKKDNNSHCSAPVVSVGNSAAGSKASVGCGSAKTELHDPVMQTSTCSLLTLDLADIDRDLVFVDKSLEHLQEHLVGAGDAGKNVEIEVDPCTSSSVDISAAGDMGKHTCPSGTEKTEVDVTVHGDYEKDPSNLKVGDQRETASFTPTLDIKDGASAEGHSDNATVLSPQQDVPTADVSDLLLDKPVDQDVTGTGKQSGDEVSGASHDDGAVCKEAVDQDMSVTRQTGEVNDKCDNRKKNDSHMNKNLADPAATNMMRQSCDEARTDDCASSHGDNSVEESVVDRGSLLPCNFPLTVLVSSTCQLIYSHTHVISNTRGSTATTAAQISTQTTTMDHSDVGKMSCDLNVSDACETSSSMRNMDSNTNDTDSDLCSSKDTNPIFIPEKHPVNTRLGNVKDCSENLMEVAANDSVSAESHLSCSGVEAPLEASPNIIPEIVCSQDLSTPCPTEQQSDDPSVGQPVLPAKESSQDSLSTSPTSGNNSSKEEAAQDTVHMSDAAATMTEMNDCARDMLVKNETGDTKISLVADTLELRSKDIDTKSQVPKEGVSSTEEASVARSIEQLPNEGDVDLAVAGVDSNLVSLPVSVPQTNTTQDTYHVSVTSTPPEPAGSPSHESQSPVCTATGNDLIDLIDQSETAS